MSDDERMILYTPIGYLHAMVAISVTKRALATRKLSTGEQLEMLEALGKTVDRYLTAEAVAAIKPICETGAQIVHEAMQADGEHGIESFHLLSSLEVFNNLLALNPSLMDAIRLCGRMPVTAPRVTAH